MSQVIGELTLLGGEQNLHTILLNQNTPFTIRTINLDHGKVGSIAVHCAAADDNGTGLTGMKMWRYRKSNAGVLTLAAPVILLANVNDSGFTNADFNLVAVNNNIEVVLTPP